MKVVGMDVGSTTVKAVVVENAGCCGRTISATIRGRRKRFWNSCCAWRANAVWSPAATSSCSPARAAGLLRRWSAARLIQEVVAVATAVEKLHPDVQLRLRDRRRRHEDDLFHASEAGRTSKSTCNRPAAAAPAPSSRRPRASCRFRRRRWRR